MSHEIPPAREVLGEALDLASECLADVELSRVPLGTAALKASRLARLLNRFDEEKIFRFEASGYPTTPTGVPRDAWRLAELAGRTYLEKDFKSKETKTFAYLNSIEELEAQTDTARIGLQVAQDRDVSVSSANPTQFVWTPIGNALERGSLRDQIATATKRLAARRAFLHRFASETYYELKYSQVAEDVFSAVRQGVDAKVGLVVPDAVQKFTAVHDGLRSSNPEDWSNSVHSCRRILQDLADSVFPPQGENRTVDGDGGRREIELGSEHFINRLVCFVQDQSRSRRYSELVGSHLSYLGDRLDAIFRAAQKGSHASVTKDEANRYVVYTYMLVGDILGLVDAPEDAA